MNQSQSMLRGVRPNSLYIDFKVTVLHLKSIYWIKQSFVTVERSEIKCSGEMIELTVHVNQKQGSISLDYLMNN